MRVAVVGAGVSGLAAVKCCRDEGLDVVCFERRNDLGGLWNYTENVEPGQSNVARLEITTALIILTTQLCIVEHELSAAVKYFRSKAFNAYGGCTSRD